MSLANNIDNEVFWDKLGSKVMRELEHRLTDQELASEVPGTLLMGLADRYIKHLEKKAALEEATTEYMTALEAIDQEGLPDDVKITILNDYIEKLNEDIAEARSRLEQLQEAHSDGV